MALGRRQLHSAQEESELIVTTQRGALKPAQVTETGRKTPRSVPAFCTKSLKSYTTAENMSKSCKKILLNEVYSKKSTLFW